MTSVSTTLKSMCASLTGIERIGLKKLNPVLQLMSHATQVSHDDDDVQVFFDALVRERSDNVFFDFESYPASWKKISTHKGVMSTVLTISSCESMRKTLGSEKRVLVQSACQAIQKFLTETTGADFEKFRFTKRHADVEVEVAAEVIVVKQNGDETSVTEVAETGKIDVDEDEEVALLDELDLDDDDQEFKDDNEIKTKHDRKFDAFESKQKYAELRHKYVELQKRNEQLEQLVKETEQDLSELAEVKRANQVFADNHGRFQRKLDACCALIQSNGDPQAQSIFMATVLRI